VDLAQNLSKIKTSKISVSISWTLRRTKLRRKYKKDRAGGARQFEILFSRIGHEQIGKSCLPCLNYFEIILKPFRAMADFGSPFKNQTMDSQTS
jgi:hypothetical protein